MQKKKLEININAPCNYKLSPTCISILEQLFLTNNRMLNIAKNIYNNITVTPMNKMILQKNLEKISIHYREKDGIKYNIIVYKYNDINNIPKILKIYNYDGDNNIESLTIKEITFQIYAKNIIKECEFNVPNIYKYGKIILDEASNLEGITYRCIFFIEMEYLSYFTLSKFFKFCIKSIIFALKRLVNNVCKSE